MNRHFLLPAVSVAMFAAWLVEISAPQLQAAAVWSTAQGNASHTAYVPGVLDASQFHLLWSLKHTGFHDLDSLQSVAAADGKVFIVKRTWVQSEGEIWARDGRTGAMLWHNSIPSGHRYESPAAYADGRVYVHAGGHSVGTTPPTVFCFDALTGSSLWATPHEGQTYEHGVPAIYGGTLYTSGGYYGGMDAYDAVNGSVKWSIRLPQQYGWSPAVQNDTIYLRLEDGSGSPGPSPGRLYAIDRFSGAVKNEIIDEERDYGASELVLLGEHDNAIVHRDKGSSWWITSYDLTSRTKLWDVEGSVEGTTAVQMALANGALYTAMDEELVVRDELTGARLWSWTAPDNIHRRSNIVVTDSHAFLTTGNTIFAIDVRTHQTVWQYPANVRQLAIADGVLYAVQTRDDADATIYAFHVAVPEPSSLLQIGIAAACVLAAGIASRRNRPAGAM